MARLKVLISGAGIAGNALAFWLSKLGHDVTIIERFPTLRATGLQIDLRGHGIEVMKRMGLADAFRSKAAPEQGMQIVDRSGKRRAFFPANKTGKGIQSFTTEWEIMRGDLCRIMYEATEKRAKYVFGTSIESFEKQDGVVHVRFKDGKTDTFDLLVGADGLHSRVRRTMLGSGTHDAFFPVEGQHIVYFTMPKPMQPGEEYIATVYFTHGGRSIMVRRKDPDAIQVYFPTRTDSSRLKNARLGDVKEEKAAFEEIYKDAGWKAEELLKGMDEADDFYCERMGLVKLESWSKGCVTLVGDAAYCPSANTGMGTTSGIVGAYVLAGEIGRHCGNNMAAGEDTKDGLVAALKAYEQTFRPFMNQVQKGVLENPNNMPSSAFGVAILNWMFAFASMFRINIFKWILKEDVKGWDLPEYEELLRE